MLLRLKCARTPTGPSSTITHRKSLETSAQRRTPAKDLMKVYDMLWDEVWLITEEPGPGREASPSVEKKRRVLNRANVKRDDSRGSGPPGRMLEDAMKRATGP